MMDKVDYIIVGDGYAALFFAHQLILNRKSFRIFSEGKKGASQVSAGIINPVVLKKFTTFWKAEEQINFLKKTLLEIENYTGKNYFIQQPIHRIFHDENERNLWIKKSNTDELKTFLSNEFAKIDGVINEFFTGKVLQSARLNVTGFFQGIIAYLEDRGHLINEKFCYSELLTNDNRYKDYSFKNIVFCEGIGVKKNPFFSDIPVEPNKGHHLKVELTTQIPSGITLKKKHFLFPLENGRYYYGGTYDREQFHQDVDSFALKQLQNGLEEFYPYPFQIKEVSFGFRPTVKDRRPILGNHTQFKNLYVFNGLGARGILNGCYFAHHLYNHIEKGEKLYPEVDLKRFNT